MRITKKTIRQTLRLLVIAAIIPGCGAIPKTKSEVVSASSTPSVSHTSLPETPTMPSQIEPRNNYTEANPKLLGIAIYTNKEAVVAKLGPSLVQYVMQDEQEPITVLEYKDFKLGFDQLNMLKFIEIRTAKIDPGLYGVRLGGKVEDVLKALGTPDMNTKYVLNYTSHGTVLKLDIDPDTEIIRSIKLFGLY